MSFKFNIFTSRFDVVEKDKKGLVLGRVPTYADLPATNVDVGDIYYVEQTTGIWFSKNRTEKGSYVWTGTAWEQANEFSAADIAYYNVDSGLISTDVQNAIDELAQLNVDHVSYKGNIDAAIGTLPTTAKVGDMYRVAVEGDNLGNLDGPYDHLNTRDVIMYTNKNADNDPTNPDNWIVFQRNIDDAAFTQFLTELYSVLGVLPGSSDLGTFTGSTITDNVSIKQALQELETEVETKSDIGHTHVEADITDLDKYTQAEVDTLLEQKATLNVGNVDIYVAPDAGSAQPGDFIGGAGIISAFREATKYIIQNPTSFIRIYLRDGEYTLTQAIECSHPQAKKTVQLRALNLQNAASMTSLESSLVMNDQVADDAALAASYNVIINCPSHAMFFDKGSGIETIDSIMFRYTGSNTSRSAVYCAQQGQASIVRCATIGFPYAIRALEFSSVGIVTGNLFLYCDISTIRAEEMSVVRVTQGTGYPTRFHSLTSYTIYALTKAYIRVVAAAAGRISIYNDTTNRACVYIASQSTAVTTRVDLIGGNQGWLVTNNSDCTINGNPTVTGNNSYAVHVDRNASALVTDLTGDPTGTATQQTVFAENNSFIEETGTHTNITFNPTPGSATDSSNIV